MKHDAHERLADLHNLSMARFNRNINILLQLSKSWCTCVTNDTLPLGPLIGYAVQQRMPLRVVKSGSRPYAVSSGTGSAHVEGGAGIEVCNLIGTVANYVILKLGVALAEAGHRPLQLR